MAHASIIVKDGQTRGEVVEGDLEELGMAGLAAVQGLIAIATGSQFAHASREAIVDVVIDRLIVGLRPRH